MISAAELKTEAFAVKQQKVIPLPPVVGAEQVYYRYSDMVYRLALARCRKNSDAEDVMQDVFVRYIRFAPAFESAEHQRAWLVRTTINCSNSLLGGSWRKLMAELDEQTASVGSPIDSSDTSRDVYAAVMRLPTDQRTAIHLYYYEGYKINEIAELTGSNENTVKSWLRRAKSRLEKDLKGDYFDV